MRIFLIGDIVGNGGVEYLRTHLGSIKKLKNIDFVVAKPKTPPRWERASAKRSQTPCIAVA